MSYTMISSICWQICLLSAFLGGILLARLHVHPMASAEHVAFEGSCVMQHYYFNNDNGFTKLAAALPEE